MKRIHSFTVKFSNNRDKKWLVDTEVVYGQLKCGQPIKPCYTDFSSPVKSITQKVKRNNSYLNTIHSQSNF